MDIQSQSNDVAAVRHTHVRWTELPRLDLNRLPLVCIAVDADYRVLEWNAEAEKTFGYTKREAVGKVGPELVCIQPLSPDVRQLLDRLEAGAMDAHCTNPNLTRDGQTIVCEWFNTPYFDGEGRFRGLLAVGRDITRQTEIERELAEFRLRFQNLFESVLEAIVLADDRGGLVDANAAACTLLGLTRDEVSKMTPFGLRFRCESKHHTVSRNVVTVDCKDGSMVEVECRWIARFESGSLYSISRKFRTSGLSGGVPVGNPPWPAATAPECDSRDARSRTEGVNRDASQPLGIQSPTKMPISMLTNRQRIILRLVCDGVPSKTIAKKLDVSVRTIDTERAKILKAFDAKNFVQLASVAAEFLR
jgi:PAS domain S-box-containing protein